MKLNTLAMKQFYSLSQYPGKTGTYYYNLFFDKFGIDATYTALACNPNEFEDTFKQLTSDHTTYGISVSMPYKNTVTYLCDNLDSLAHKYGICNTIAVNNGHTVGYNCDIYGLMGIISEISIDDKILILGDGSIGQMFYHYLIENDYMNVNMYSRKNNNWHDRHEPADIIINCTSLGTSEEASPLQSVPDKTRCVIDLALRKTILYEQSLQSQVKYISGLSFYAHQFLKQFEIYTGMHITIDQFNEATGNDYR
jgi:shikimate 5-dehydrogenase